MLRIPVACRKVTPKSARIIVCDKQLVNVRGDKMTQTFPWTLVVLWEPPQTPNAHMHPCPHCSKSYWDNNGDFSLLTQVCEITRNYI